MAKTNAPLFSLKASGKLADALVYFNWKGINAVRSYVIPSNPRTTPQLTQRGYLTDATAAWHNTSLTATDRQSWANWATALAAVMTGFNAFIKHYLWIRINAKSFPQFMIYANTVKTSVAITSNLQSSASVTAASCFYGISPTNMINSVVCTGSSAGWIATITGLATGTKYYLQWVGTAPAAYVATRSGIYTETTT